MLQDKYRKEITLGGVRRLFINNEGFDKLTENIFATTKDMKEQSFADLIECRDYVMRQLKLASRLTKVASISLTANCELRIRTRDLFISNTETGILRKFFVGKWKIAITKDGEYHFTPYNRDELGYYSEIWGSGTVHPHISGRRGQACLGNAATPLQLYLNTGDIKTLVIYVLGYLESVNINDSAGKEVGYCKEVELDDEGNALHDEDGNYKFKRNEFDREDNYRISQTTNNNVDIEHHEYITECHAQCTSCNKVYNSYYMKRLDGGYFVCEECSKNMKECAICGRLSTKIIHDNVNDLDYCEGCASTYFNKCNYCDEYMFSKIDKEDILGSIIKLTETREVKKHNLLVRTSDNRIMDKRVCDDCMKIIKDGKIPATSAIKLERINTTEDMISVPTKIPFNKYREKCASCLSLVPVENMISSGMSTSSAPACGSCMRVPATYLTDTNFEDRLYDKYMKEKYIKIATYIEDDEVVIHVVPFNERHGTLLPRAAFKDKDVWNTIKLEETIKYKLEGRE